MNPRPKLKWLRALRERWGFKPEGFDAELFAAASAGASWLLFTVGALLIAIFTRSWIPTALGFLFGWGARSFVPNLSAK